MAVQIPLLFRVSALSLHYDRVSRFFASAKLRAAFTFQDMYIGLSPYSAPATFSLLQATEFCDGVWYSKGGLYAIIAALSFIVTKLGVVTRTNASVDRIEVDTRSRKATGVRLSTGEVLQADVVVATADLPYVYDQLLPEEPARQKLKKMRYSSSTISFFWALDKVLSCMVPAVRCSLIVGSPFVGLPTAQTPQYVLSFGRVSEVILSDI
eukprot:SAG31_NODE_1198_length_9441_cov_3.648897_6_plen_210_part_00